MPLFSQLKPRIFQIHESGAPITCKVVCQKRSVISIMFAGGVRGQACFFVASMFVVRVNLPDPKLWARFRVLSKLLSSKPPEQVFDRKHG